MIRFVSPGSCYWDTRNLDTKCRAWCFSMQDGNFALVYTSGFSHSFDRQESKTQVERKFEDKENDVFFTTVSRNLMSNGCLAWSEEIDHNMVRVRDMLPETGWMVSH